MKNIVSFKITKPEGSITIDAYNPEIQEFGLDYLINNCLPYTHIFEHIFIKNFISIPAELLNRLTNQYLHGAIIEFITPSKKFNNLYSAKYTKPFYTYQFVELDLSKPMPKSLAQFEFDYKGKRTTYLDALKSLHSIRYLPSEIWNAIDSYSKQQIAKCREYNKGNYEFAELWFKQLMKDCSLHNIKVFSPNKKTYYEAMAELDFDKNCLNFRLDDGLRPLNEDELAFLHRYARVYGVDIPTFKWRYNSRKTKDGYTQEPEYLTCGMSNTDWARVIYDYRNASKGEILPKFVRQGLKVQECTNDKLLRDAYTSLIWLMKNLKDEALAPGYKRCPHCHQIYRESEGCECGACQPIEFVSADNLFYGISSTYEDYESTSEAYDDLEDFTEDLD